MLIRFLLSYCCGEEINMHINLTNVGKYFCGLMRLRIYHNLILEWVRVNPVPLVSPNDFLA